MTKFAMRWLASGAILFALLLTGCSLFQSPDEPSPAPTNTPTATPTNMPTPEPATTPTLEPTATPTAAPTYTLVPTATPTPEPTATPITAPMHTPTPEPATTPTPEPTATPTPAPMHTPVPTATPTPEPTATPTPAPMHTPVPTATPTPEPTATPTTAPTHTPAPAATPTPEPTATPTTAPTHTPTPEPAGTPAATPPPGFFRIPLDINSPWREAFDAFNASEQTCIRDDLGEELLASVLDRPISTGGTAEAEQWEVVVGKCLDPETAVSLVISASIAGAEASVPDLAEVWEACIWQSLSGADAAALAASLIAQIARDASPASMTLADEFYDRVLGCVGDVASLPEVTPKPAPVPTQDEFISVSAGGWGHHTCGVTTDGSVECWGNDEWGQSTPPSGGFASVSAGGYHTCGVRTDGSVECWGNDGEGQSRPPSGEFASVSAGAAHTCGVRTDGPVECWGNDEWGQSTPEPRGHYPWAYPRANQHANLCAYRHG